jgi:hypothetical protein
MRGGHQGLESSSPVVDVQFPPSEGTEDYEAPIGKQTYGRGQK